MLRPALALASVSLLAAAGLVRQDDAAQDPAGQEPSGPAGPKLVELTENVDFVYSRFGGNVAILEGEGGSLVIDTNLNQLSREFLELVDAQVGETPRFIVNTHWHGDHTGNNATYGSRAVTIVAHERVRARLAGDAGVAGRVGEGTPRAALPGVTFDDDMVLHLGDQRVELEHYGPGHTDGDTVAWLPTERVVHMGDLFFESRYPFIDLDSGGDARGYLAAVGAALDELVAREGDQPGTWQVIPGHGQVTDVEGLRAYQGALQTCIERVTRALADGRTPEQMVEDGLLQDYEAWSWEFIDTTKFIGTLARSLAD